ncbi:MAG: response regulator [Candidatus Rokuibacteriota bacterium]
MSDDPGSSLSVFLAEARETLAVFESGQGHLREPDGPTADGVTPLRVVAHRLAGAAALHGFRQLARLASVTEHLLERLVGAPPHDVSHASDFLTDAIRVLESALDAIDATGREPLDEIAAFTARHPALFAPAPPESPALRSAVSGTPPTAARSADEALSQMDRFVAENADVAAYFVPEATEHLEVMTRSLLALERSGRSEVELATLLRAVHTLKGAASIVGLTALGALAHQIEEAVVAVREERVAFSPIVTQAVFAGVDVIRHLVGLTDDASPEPARAWEGAAAGLAALKPDPGRPEAETALAGSVSPVRPESPAPPQPPSAPRKGTRAPGIRVALDRLDSLMNLAGELTIARSRLDRHVRELERVGDLMGSSRAHMSGALREFEAAATPAPGDVSRVGGPEPLTTLFTALEFDRYDDADLLARSAGEIAADLAETQGQLATLVRRVQEDAAQIQRLTGTLRSEITRARLVPVGTLFARFSRQVREAARTAGRMVILEWSGESVEVDNTVIEEISDPILHLVRNAIFHGIETEEERRGRGKTPHGTVSLSASHRGGAICIEVIDDGRGIDVERVKEQAVRQGFLPAEVAGLLSPSEALNLIFLPGLSTAPVVTTDAGRGVGMDVVRTNVSRLNGEIAVETDPGVGTRFTMTVPLTLAVSEALMVRVGTEVLAIPFNAVRRVLAPDPERIQSAGHRERLSVDHELLDLVRLDQVLALPPCAATARVPVVVVRATGKSVALAVDELLGKEEIVIKPLGGLLEGVGPFSGATISAEGRVILLLDPVRLTEPADGRATAREMPASLDEPRALTPPSHAPLTPRILLVDDSVSVRKFVGQMLEKAGLDVITANDGAEALARLDETAVHVVITDLEMPRLNGFELIQQLRQRPAMRDVPLVVLTTRAGAKHLNLARWLGVQHYVSKPVDEEAFVGLIVSLAPSEAALGRPSG